MSFFLFLQPFSDFLDLNSMNKGLKTRKRGLAQNAQICSKSQRPRIDLNKMFLPRPNTTTA